MESEGDEEHAAQASSKHAVHLEEDRLGAMPRATLSLSFYFARQRHIDLILTLDLI